MPKRGYRFVAEVRAAKDVRPPDGKTVAFPRARNPEINDLYLVPITGGEPRQVSFDHETSVSLPTWTPDGRAMLFISNRDSGPGGANNLWKVLGPGALP